MKMVTAFGYIERALRDPNPARQEDALEVLKLLERSILGILMTVNDMNSKAIGREGVTYLYGEEELRSMAENVLRRYEDVHVKSQLSSHEEREEGPGVLPGPGSAVSPISRLRANGAVSGIT